MAKSSSKTRGGSSPPPPETVSPQTVVKPRYDKLLRQLWVGEVMVLENQRARNRHLVLLAFEEQGWPPAIVDPLGGDGSAENKLRDAVYGLNDGQDPWLIDFSADGTGYGIRWKFVR